MIQMTKIVIVIKQLNQFNLEKTFDLKGMFKIKIQPSFIT